MLLPCYQLVVPEAGCDEAGRGCLAGPVFAAAVILPKNVDIPYLNDSKQLTKKRREFLRPLIEESAIAWAVAQVSEKEIDRINILNASILAMHRALDTLQQTPGLIIVDGNRFHSYQGIEHKTIIKGDAKYMNIAAASVLAKTHRDSWMQDLHNKNGRYNWIQNKGYPTVQHRIAIENYGLTKYHRKSFNVKPIPKGL